LFYQSQLFRSFPSRNRERKRLHPKAAPLTRTKRRKPRKRGPRPTSIPPRRKPNWLKPSITWSRLTIIPIPTQKWFINESILASLTGCFRPAIKKFVEAHRSFISQANNTHGLGPGHNRGKARTNPDAIPELVKNFKKDALGQPF
jgi:hypothetical protein